MYLCLYSLFPCVSYMDCLYLLLFWAHPPNPWKRCPHNLPSPPLWEPLPLPLWTILSVIWNWRRQAAREWREKRDTLPCVISNIKMYPYSMVNIFLIKLFEWITLIFKIIWFIYDLISNHFAYMIVLEKCKNLMYWLFSNVRKFICVLELKINETYTWI